MIRLVSDLRTRYDDLDNREQRALLMLSGFLLVVFFYLLVWSPVNDFRLDSESDYHRQVELLSYLRSTESEARAVASGAGGRRQGGQSLLSSVSSAARTVGITPSRLQPEGGDSVSVWFDSVRFTELMRWLEKLETERTIVVSQISIDSRDEPGMVSARLILK